uniref:Uncharacterized protein n=1 Tax=Arundo donax TaxID=35708 RepID=A0A0A9AVE1_ARUDO
MISSYSAIDMLYCDFTTAKRATADKHECVVFLCTNSSALATIL